MENKKENISIRIPAELNKKFSEYVTQLGMSKNAFILNLIHKAIKAANKKSPTNSDS